MNKDYIINKLVIMIKNFIAEYMPEYLWIPVSGGKDSALAWALVSKATNNYIAVHILIPGQTHADNLRSVIKQSKVLGIRDSVTVKISKTKLIRQTLGEAIETCVRPCLLKIVAFDTYGRDFWKAMKQYGFPAPLGRFGKGIRWCCGTFKHRVLQRLPFNGTNNGKPWKYGVNGIKATDSPYRKKRYKNYVMTWEKTHDTYLFPLLKLDNEQVWSLLKYLGIYTIVYQQYSKWGRSPNCMWCPMLGAKYVEKTVQALPQNTKLFIAKELSFLLPRYVETTYSYKKINEWLRLLELNNKSKIMSSSHSI